MTKKQIIPPYVPYKSFHNFINGLRDQLPQHITRDVYPGSNSGKAAMGAALKAMKLVNIDDTPSEKLSQLIESEDNYRLVLNEILLETYDFLSDPAMNLANTTSDKVKERFVKMGAGGSTVSKCMQFFLLAAKDAGIEVSRYVKAPKPDRKPTRAKLKPPENPTTTNENSQRAGMIRITIPLHGMADGEVCFQKDMTKSQWDYALKMAQLILDNYRINDIEEENDDEIADEEDS